MARPLRICIADGVYHVIARGNARECVYRDDDDRSIFVAALAHAVDRFGWICHAYCLMDNHYHLVVETPRPNLPLGMRQLNGVYAQRFNRRHDRSGHVFESRYRSILVEKEAHLLTVCRYVVLNPIRAAVCHEPGDYRWSSYAVTAGTAATASFVCVDSILRKFGETRAIAQARYREFVAAGISDAVEERVVGERLGRPSFLRDRFGYDPPLAEIPRVHVEPLRTPLEDIFAAAESPISTAYRRHGYALREIAEHLGCHYSTVSRRMRSEESAA
jgi:putative transposase